jgi:hypothetical protein
MAAIGEAHDNQFRAAAGAGIMLIAAAGQVSPRGRFRTCAGCSAPRHLRRSGGALCPRRSGHGRTGPGDARVLSPPPAGYVIYGITRSARGTRRQPAASHGYACPPGRRSRRPRRTRSTCSVSVSRWTPSVPTSAIPADLARQADRQLSPYVTVAPGGGQAYRRQRGRLCCSPRICCAQNAYVRTCCSDCPRTRGHRCLPKRRRSGDVP